MPPTTNFPLPPYVPAPGGATTAADVSYVGAYPNVQEALDALFYVAPNITSFTGGSNNEIGSTVNNVNLAWAINKAIASQSINQGIGSLDAALRELALTSQGITSNRTYTLTVSDGTNQDQASTTVAFLNKRYWGVSAETTLDDAEIIALSQELSSSRLQSRTFDCTGGRYFYFAFPASFGTPSFRVGGLAFSDMTVVTRDFTNASGHTSSYQIWRSTNLQTGAAIPVEVL